MNSPGFGGGEDQVVLAGKGAHGMGCSEQGRLEGAGRAGGRPQQLWAKLDPSGAGHDVMAHGSRAGWCMIADSFTVFELSCGTCTRAIPLSDRLQLCADCFSRVPKAHSPQESTAFVDHIIYMYMNTSLPLT